MNKYILLLIGICCFSLTFMAQNIKKTVQLDINRYAKKWYEIARFPHRFEKNLSHVMLLINLLEITKYLVENQVKTVDNKFKKIKGITWIPDLNETGKLKVCFFWPFSAPYWVHSIDEDYSVAIVGGLSNNYHWILSDKP